jgi:hypothetical protein
MARLLYLVGLIYGINDMVWHVYYIWLWTLDIWFKRYGMARLLHLAMDFGYMAWF